MANNKRIILWLLPLLIVSSGVLAVNSRLRGADRLEYNTVKSHFIKEDVNIFRSYPKFQGEKRLAPQLNANIEGILRQSSSEIIKSAGELNKDQPGLVKRQRWTHYDTISVEYDDRGLLSLLNQTVEYTGGAHDNIYYMSWLYDIGGKARLGESLGLTDLLGDEEKFLPPLSDYLIEALKKKGASWIVNGDIKSFKLEDLSVFVVKSQGLKFIFAPYAVGPWSEGTYEVVVPYAFLRPYMPKGSPLRRMLR